MTEAGFDNSMSTNQHHLDDAIITPVLRNVNLEMIWKINGD